MINQVAEKTIARVLGFGSAFIAVVVVTGTVTDPVNVTKLFALGGVAAAAFAVVLAFGFGQLWQNSKVLLIAVAVFLLAGLNAILNSSAPLVQNIYGAYGRNTAFVTYVLLIFILLSAVVLRSKKSFSLLIWGLLGSLLPLDGVVRCCLVTHDTLATMDTNPCTAGGLRPVAQGSRSPSSPRSPGRHPLSWLWTPPPLAGRWR
jgi:hypothetical protein